MSSSSCQREMSVGLRCFQWWVGWAESEGSWSGLIVKRWRSSDWRVWIYRTVSLVQQPQLRVRSTRTWQTPPTSGVLTRGKGGSEGEQFRFSQFFCLCQRSIVFSECLCVCAWVHVSWASIVNNTYLRHLMTEFDQTCATNELRGKDESMGSKSQGSRTMWGQICSEMHFLTLLLLVLVICVGGGIIVDGDLIHIYS